MRRFLLLLAAMSALALTCTTITAQINDLADTPTSLLRDPGVRLPDPGDDELCDDDEHTGCFVSQVATELAATIKSVTFMGAFCDNPVVTTFDTDATPMQMLLLSAGPNHITAELLNDRPRDQLYAIDCPCDRCELRVTIGATGPPGPPGIPGPPGGYDCSYIDGESDCCIPGDTTGCNDPYCEGFICADDPFCCEVQWDSICADQATQLALCADCCPSGCGDAGCACNCCDGGNGVGCDDEACEALICGMDSYCCNVAWDVTCNEEAEQYCECC